VGMLVRVRDYIKKHGVVSTQQMARFFRIDEQALDPMLALWVNKGVIKPCEQSSSCQSSCFRCKVNAPVYYEMAVIDS
jgi:hypothetical protein